MNTENLTIARTWCDDARLWIEVADGRVLGTPFKVMPSLDSMDKSERASMAVTGETIHWMCGLVTSSRDLFLGNFERGRNLPLSEFGTYSEDDTSIDVLRLWFDCTRFWVELRDGRILGTPFLLFPSLLTAGKELLTEYELCGDVVAWWGELDVQIEIGNLLCGCFENAKHTLEKSR